MANANLNKVASQKFDEFYTQIADIEKELWYYSHHFKGVTVSVKAILTNQSILI